MVVFACLQVQFLSEHQAQKTIVYFLTCACVDYFLLAMRRLPRLQGLFIKSIHGRMKQVGRQKAIKAFTESEGGTVVNFLLLLPAGVSCCLHSNISLACLV